MSRGGVVFAWLRNCLEVSLMRRNILYKYLFIAPASLSR
jgi:hypothetical protein